MIYVLHLGGGGREGVAEDIGMGYGHHCRERAVTFGDSESRRECCGDMGRDGVRKLIEIDKREIWSVSLVWWSYTCHACRFTYVIYI